ncbi:MAG: FKBP-type peptidyl-prolyl cis-trans isomerase [Acidimicrobiales bacterium]|nr:FKBP-type peptidyl-prolyl cis-trans isomerase [Acidimicrobiales bacterium]
MSGPSSRRIAAVALALLLLAAGCGSKSNVLKGNLVQDAGPCTPAEVAPSTSQAPSTPAKPATLPTKVVSKDLTVGKGCVAATGKYLKVNYLGQLAKTGAIFDSSWTRNEPLDVQLGGGQIIQGWEEGLAGMKVGGRRLLVIPAPLAYGKNGLPPKIGADEPLQFVVDLLGVYDTPKCKPPVKAPTNGAPVVTMPQRGATELQTKDITPGTGAAAKSGSYVQVRYVGVACSTGAQVDSTWAKGTDTTTITVGGGKPVPGWDQGLTGAKAGGRRQIDVPATLAYGAQGSATSNVGPNEPITYVIDIVSVSDTLSCKPANGVPAAKGKPTVQMPATGATKLVIKDLITGKGMAAKKGSTVDVRYVGIACSTGKQFDASWDKGTTTFPVTLGQGQVIPGWDQGLIGVKPGGRRQLDIPAALAYGPQGQGSIGPNEPLTFVIDVVSVK